MNFDQRLAQGLTAQLIFERLMSNHGYRMIPMGYENYARHIIPEISSLFNDLEEFGRYSPYEDFPDAFFALGRLKFMPDFFVFKRQIGDSSIPFAAFIEVKSTISGKVTLRYEAAKALHSLEGMLVCLDIPAKVFRYLRSSDIVREFKVADENVPHYAPYEIPCAAMPKCSGLWDIPDEVQIAFFDEMAVPLGFFNKP
jgi:hypothetical protein